MAEKKRAKMGVADKPDIVEILLNPEHQQAKEVKLEKLKKQYEEKERLEETFKPQILKRKHLGLSHPEEELSAPGKKNMELYRLASQKEKSFKTVEQLEFERNISECKFVPKINKQIYYERKKVEPQRNEKN